MTNTAHNLQFHQRIYISTAKPTSALALKEKYINGALEKRCATRTSTM